MNLNNEGYKIIDLKDIGKDIEQSFSDLKFDEYMGNGNRFRRFSQYKMNHDGKWKFEKLEHRPYMTFSKFNKVAGGIKRYYEPLQVDFTKWIGEAANEIPLDTADAWQINVHQYRVYTRPDLQGVTVPEGPHQDGHDFVMIAVIKRHKITGAKMSLFKLHDKDNAIFNYTLQDKQAALLNDRELIHYVTDIVPDEDEGYRDIFVVAFSRWADRWHGEEFENKVAAETN
ncbi:2OG-Fe dioxygenase family protein [Pantoea sp. Mb-10]|uniref:2OG-Fe dioxygenase family protein n=1 Tax=unclassified Pantoea TaxID=2630326 RepID=UPI001E485AC7|nr:MULTISPECIES: 2OG-Fe dioxygenase family protein [unclassified Pantoea]MCE0490295.1 2OG-Fe dioxygenase family protein [Pantoea sp. Mb-10]MCE0501426.1 2OG-Fe dioxygenase family protein [Pantoea sp. Pb-8]